MVNKSGLTINILTAAIKTATLPNMFQNVLRSASQYGLVYLWEINSIEITGEEYSMILSPNQIPTLVGETQHLFDVELQHNLFCENLAGTSPEIDSLKSLVRNTLRKSNNELIKNGATISTNSAQASTPTEISRKLNDTECDLEIEALIKNSVLMPNGYLMVQVDSITGLPKKNSRKKNLTLIPPLEFRDLTEEIREIDPIRINGIIRSGTDLSKNEVEIDEMTTCKLIINEIQTYVSILNSNSHNLPDDGILQDLIQQLEELIKK